MITRSLLLVPSVLVLLWAGCAGDGVAGPGAPVLAEVELVPAEAALYTLAPFDTLQLTVVASDDGGARIPQPGALSYSSSAPSIAAVSGSGLVRARAPGEATITAAVTRGDVTTTASMTVLVRVPPLAGTYDLTATITESDPAWGDLAGTRYTGVLHFDRDSPYGALGTFSGLHVTGPDGYEAQVGPGVIHGYRDSTGRLVLELSTSAFHFDLFPLETAPALAGSFSTGGHITGPFTTVRRPE